VYRSNSSVLLLHLTNAEVSSTFYFKDTLTHANMYINIQVTYCTQRCQYTAGYTDYNEKRVVPTTFHTCVKCRVAESKGFHYKFIMKTLTFCQFGGCSFTTYIPHMS